MKAFVEQCSFETKQEVAGGPLTSDSHYPDLPSQHLENLSRSQHPIVHSPSLHGNLSRPLDVKKDAWIDPSMSQLLPGGSVDSVASTGQTTTVSTLFLLREQAEDP